MHIEKALRDFSGAYQTLAMCFAESMKLPGVNFINRQDDTGDEGLRKSKLSYKPCALLDKFTLLFGRRSETLMPHAEYFYGIILFQRCT